MENEFFFFLNSGILHPLHLEPSSEDSCFLNANSLDQYSHFEPALSSIVSSPADASVSSTNASFAVREVIGKLDKVCNSPTRALCHAGGNNSTNTSCYTTPMNSPPKLSFPVTDQFLKEKLQNLGLFNSMAKNPKYPTLLADPGFTERAAKFSCFGSRSFNERTTQLGLKLNNNELSHRPSSSPCLNDVGSPMGSEENNNTTQIPEEIQGSQEGCSPISMQISCQETGSRTPTDLNSRKRKAVSKGKSGETTEVEESEDSNPKRPKSNEGDRSQNGNGGGNEDEEKQAKASQKPPEAPKDYIHVRARRGQATDSHSLAERVRREKIGERMKLLQDLVPGCNKVTGKALMLDEIINYVQSLQRQVEFLSMKLASINQKRDFNMETLLSEDLTQPNGFFGHHAQRIPQLENSISNGPMVDRLSNAAFRYNIALQFPQVDEFGQGFQQGVKMICKALFRWPVLVRTRTTTRGFIYKAFLALVYRHPTGKLSCENRH